MLSVAELVTGKGGRRDGLSFVDLVDRIHEVFSTVFRGTANSSEGGKTRGSGSVSVNVNYLAALNILEKSHRRVPRVVLDHVSIVLSNAHVKGWVLENASLSVRALRRVIQEVLAYRCKVLPTEAFLLLELVLAMRETTSLFLLTIFAVSTVKPKSAQLSPDFLLPPVFSFDDCTAG